eukprot:scaffold421287_cov61-Attheya_sp.AAC.7
MSDDGADVAYVLTGSSCHLKIEGSFIVPGYSLSMSAYWSELGGHQDSFPAAAQQLDLWACLNISMDLLAKQCRALHEQRAHPDNLHHYVDVKQ